jgi:hypothetical protein
MVRQGLNTGKLAPEMGVTRPALDQFFAESGRGTKQAKAVVYLPKLCRRLGVSLWAVVEGVDDHSRRVLLAVDLLRAYAPGRVDKFASDLVQAAEDIASAHGWQPSSDDDDAAPPRPRGRERASDVYR